MPPAASADTGLLQRLLLATPGLFLLLRPDDAFTIVGASADYLRSTHTTDAIFGRPVFDVFPDNPALTDKAGTRGLRASLERVIASGRADPMDVVRYDVRRSTADGGGFEERYWLPTNSPVLGEDGRVELIIHQVEEAAAKANVKAIEILESITEGFFTLDREWRYDYVNTEAHRILEVEPGTLAGRVIWEVYPGLEGTPFWAGYHDTMDRRVKSSFTAFYANQARWYEVTAFPAPEGISVYFRNVSDRKLLEAEREIMAAESERLRRMYETALDATVDFFYVFGTDHRAIYANASLRATWGVEDVRGKRWSDLGYEDWHAQRHDAELDRVIAERRSLRSEIPFSGTQGRRIYEYIFAPVFGADGEVVAVAGTTRDITEREAGAAALREQSARLAEADRGKDAFLATLGHELRNPLAPLRNGIELLRGTVANDERAARVHAMMERQVLHLMRLVDDLLELSRISRGAVMLQRQQVEVAEVLRHAVEMARPVVEDGRHALEVRLPTGTLAVDADPARLTQILANLLNNAARYTDPGGRLRIEAERVGDEAVVRVGDNGIGIAPDALARLFEMFNREDRQSGRNQAGLGIGLALSRRLALLHGGSLSAFSEGPGRGSEFVLRLPISQDAAPPPEVVPVPGDDVSGLRVLVIDDNRDAADSLAMVLGALGAAVEVAYSGPEGLSRFEARPAAMVLLDIGMPGMNGYDVARALRARGPRQSTRLVAVTGWGQAEDRQRAREAGFDDHLVKPADIDALVRLLAAVGPDRD